MHPNWKALSTVAWNWKQFVRSDDDEENGSRKNIPNKKINLETITGSQARTLYEEEFIKESKEKYNVKPQRKEQDEKKTIAFRKRINVPDEKWLNALLKAAQYDNLATVEDLYNQHPERINEADAFGWTALMSAAYGNSISIVKFLLDKGVNEFIIDKKGNSAFDLAKIQGHHQIISLFKNRIPKIPKENLASPLLPSPFECKICDRSFRESTKEEHDKSIVHLFKCWKGPQKTHYGIPESNKGFQIMLKDGWIRGGLGPSGSGQKFPIKTILKRDRQGLGSSSKAKPRVTHFNPGSLDAIKNPRSEARRKSYNKRDLESISRKERRKEIIWRREFNSFD